MLEHSERFRAAHPWLPESIAARWVRSYGTLGDRILAGARQLSDLGTDLGSGLHEAEVEYLKRDEWATCVEDILWRRSKLGLRLTPSEAEGLQKYLRGDAGDSTRRNDVMPSAGTEVHGSDTDHGR